MNVSALISLVLACVALSGVGNIAQVTAADLQDSITPHQSDPDCKFSPCD